MSRYLTQDIFDGMAITRAMTATVPDGHQMFVTMAEGYRRSYPDEDFTTVLVDVESAQYEVERVASELYNALFEPDAPNSAGVHLAILKELYEITIKESRKKLPFIKRIFGGTLSTTKKHRSQTALINAKRTSHLRP